MYYNFTIAYCVAEICLIIAHSVSCCMKLADKTQCVACLNFDSSCLHSYQYKKITAFSTLIEINHVKATQYFHSSHIMNSIQYNGVIMAIVLAK